MRYVITSVQNNSRLHHAFFNNLIDYCRVTESELIVLPTYTKNKEINFDEIVKPYFVTRDKELGGMVRLLAELRIPVTSMNPLNGLEPFTRAKSIVVAHPQIAFRIVPSTSDNHPMMMTTGSCNHADYPETKAGILATFHHSLGALVIDFSISGFLPRHLSVSKNGAIVDEGTQFHQGRVTKMNTSGLVLGDLHIGSTCPTVMRKTLSMIADYEPEQLVLHDCFDGITINPHEEHNNFAKYNRRFDSLTTELEANVSTLNALAQLVESVIVVDSNHNDFLDRWLAKVDYRTLDKETSLLYLKLATEKANGVKDSYAHYCKPKVKDNVRFLQVDEDYLISNILVSLHGHKGANGSRGSLKQFSKAGDKTISGHSHSPGIEKGAYAVGTSTHLRLGYNSGMSNWANTHCLIYENGKRQLIHLNRTLHE